MTAKANWLGPPPGSRILVAGGCGGIGRALVEECVEADLHVKVLDLPASIAAAAMPPCVEPIGFDARETTSVDDAVRAVRRSWDGLDSFVFLTGFPILPRRSLAQTPPAKWDELMAVNLRSAWLLAAALLPLLEQGSHPSIVSVASSLAYQVMPGMGAYAVSKGGLVSLTKALAMENAPRIRANVVAPGAVETKFLGGGTGRESEGTDRSWFDALSEKYVATIPLARVADPIDVVGPILFLAGPGAAYMTGQVLHLNGGRLTP